MKHLFNLLTLNCICQLIQAQTPMDTLASKSIAPVVITTTRFDNAAADAPFAVSVIGTERLQRGTQQLSLTESLVAVPGVFAMSPDNFAQDLRVSIRGFGARSAFGIRGIRLVVDGLPESTPDGQADVDNLDLSALQNVEILRGAASGLYGNATGGVMSFQTAEPTEQTTIGLQTSFGSFGFQKYAAKTGFTTGKLGVFLSATHNRTTGFREQSQMNQTIANGKFRFQISSSAKIALLVNIGNSPVAEDAGGLTAEQVAENRRQARPQNVQFDAGESVNQQKFGSVFEKKWSEKHQLKLRGFLAFRQFAGRLAFQPGGSVEFDRQFQGLGATYIYSGKQWRTQIGIETDAQRDERRRFDNLDGTKGNPTLEQTESFRSAGAFWLNEIRFAEKIKLTVGARADLIRLAVTDHFLSDGDQSGNRRINRFNPTVGLTYKFTPQIAAYGNLNSSYETPTLNELSANPTGAGGFNADLNPQSALSVEIGAKMQVAQSLNFELALFNIHLRDEIVPYQLSQQPGRTFYRNAGRSTRNGVEISLNGQITQGLGFFTNYTFSDFKYTEYETNGNNFDGNRQPGIPQHIVYLELRWQHRTGVFVTGQAQYTSAFFADDANTVDESKRWLLNLRSGFSEQIKALRLEPFFGINNLSSTVYNGNILINAAGGRYFEPASGVYFFGGLKLNFIN
ncbi:MAG TPA: TonB-dependent receptor [Saprospiraceae bacterium]|nr:TonB-dependent receptor [Saprospiraceae bacterium]